MLCKLIELLKYIFIGIIQGISEILPISSSGHLFLAYKLLDISLKNQLDITVYLHFASSLALCLFFKEKLKKLFLGFFLYIFKKDASKKEDFKFVLFLLFATIPAAVTGFILEDIINNYFSNSIVLAICFLVTALILLISSKFKSSDNSLYTLKNILMVGLFQSLAIFPGISRSGVTISAGKLAKLDKTKQKELSFMLLIPISVGSFILSLIKSLSYEVKFSEPSFLYVVSMIITFMFTYIALHFLMDKIKEKHYVFFSIYLIILSSIILFFHVL